MSKNKSHINTVRTLSDWQNTVRECDNSTGQDGFFVKGILHAYIIAPNVQYTQEQDYMQIATPVKYE